MIYFISEERSLLLFLKLLEQQPGRFIKEKKKKKILRLHLEIFESSRFLFALNRDFDKRVEQQVLLSNPWHISRKAIEGNVKATH